MRWPTPPTGPAGAGITNTAPRPATTPTTELGSHDQRSTTAVLTTLPGPWVDGRALRAHRWDGLGNSDPTVSRWSKTQFPPWKRGTRTGRHVLVLPVGRSPRIRISESNAFQE